VPAEPINDLIMMLTGGFIALRNAPRKSPMMSNATTRAILGSKAAARGARYPPSDMPISVTSSSPK
jgi:hypothetical protein